MQYANSTKFLQNLLENTKRYQSLFSSQVDKFFEVSAPNSIRPTISMVPDTFDVLMNQVSSSATEQSISCDNWDVRFSGVHLHCAEAAGSQHR